MPVVTVTLFEGRDDETKARIARQIADVVAENTGNSIESVHVLFDEKERGQWGRGLTLASRRTEGRSEPVRCEYVSLSRIKYDPATEAEYLKLRRDVIDPGMATQEGFISTLLVRPHDRENEYLLAIKWMSEAHATAYRESKVHDDLKRQALAILPKPLETTGADLVHLDPD